MFRSARAGVLGLIAIVLVLTQQACSGEDPVAPPVTPAPLSSTSDLGTAPSPSATSATPTTAAPASPSPVPRADLLSGRRQLFLFPLDDGKEVPESVVSVTGAGRATITGDYGDRALFVPVPIRPGSEQFLLKTGKLRSGGEPLCLMVQSNGSNPLTLVTKGCDTREKDQRFTFEADGKDGQGRTTYLVRAAELFLHWTPAGRYGLVVQESGEGDDLTRWVLIDRGGATLPAD